MTKEEYREIVGKVNSENPAERLQASILLAIFPDEDAKYKFSESSLTNIENKISEVVKNFKEN